MLGAGKKPKTFYTDFATYHLLRPQLNKKPENITKMISTPQLMRHWCLNLMPSLFLSFSFVFIIAIESSVLRSHRAKRSYLLLLLTHTFQD